MIKLIYVLIVSITLLSGCSESLRKLESEYTIKVGGTPGTVFKGSFSLPGSPASARPMHVEGTAPAEYKGKGITVLCVFRKADVKGTLRVEIIKGKTVIDKAETSAPFGVITMGRVPNQEGLINLVVNRVLDALRIW